MEFERDWFSINFKDLLLESLPGFTGWFVVESVWTKLTNDIHLLPHKVVFGVAGCIMEKHD